MEEHRCDVAIYRAAINCPRCAEPNVMPGGCERCRIGCLKSARFRNPHYAPDGHGGGGIYNYAEWLCAEHYDDVMEFWRRKDSGDLEPWEMMSED